MENSDGLKLLVECEGCGTVFEASGRNVKKREFTSKGQSIYLTYYDCRNCNKRHFVQLDTSETNQLLRELTTMVAKNAGLRKRGLDMSKKQLAKLNKKREYLAQRRTDLMKEFSGQTVICMEDGKETTGLTFSV